MFFEVPPPVFFETEETHPFLILGIYLAGLAKLLSVVIGVAMFIVPAVGSTELHVHCCRKYDLDSDFTLGPMMFFVVFTFFQSTAYTLYDYLGA